MAQLHGPGSYGMTRTRDFASLARTVALSRKRAPAYDTDIKFEPSAFNNVLRYDPIITDEYVTTCSTPREYQLPPVSAVMHQKQILGYYQAVVTIVDVPRHDDGIPTLQGLAAAECVQMSAPEPVEDAIQHARWYGCYLVYTRPACVSRTLHVYAQMDEALKRCWIVSWQNCECERDIPGTVPQGACYRRLGHLYDYDVTDGLVVGCRINDFIKLTGYVHPYHYGEVIPTSNVFEMDEGDLYAREDLQAFVCDWDYFDGEYCDSSINIRGVLSSRYEDRIQAKTQMLSNAHG